jgi:hypothetical protein
LGLRFASTWCPQLSAAVVRGHRTAFSARFGQSLGGRIARNVAVWVLAVVATVAVIVVFWN